jgi:hypothetical protein
MISREGRNAGIAIIIQEWSNCKEELTKDHLSKMQPTPSEKCPNGRKQSISDIVMMCLGPLTFRL